MSHNIQKADGAADIIGLQAHLSQVKGKYQQNAKNYEANMGKPLNFNADDDEPAQSEEQLTFVKNPKADNEQHAAKDKQSGKGEL